MVESLQYLGYWWLPGQKKFKIPGKLQYSPGTGISLELEGNFDREYLLNPYGINILGESSRGEKITAYQCFCVRSEQFLMKANKGISFFLANKAFIGRHFWNRDDAKFKRILFFPTYLDEWLHISSLDVDFKGDGFVISYKFPESLTFPIDNDLTIKIGFMNSGPNLGEFKKINFEQKSCFVIEKHHKAHFNDFGELIYHLNNFLSLATMSPVFPLEVEGFLDNEQVPIKILLNSPGLNNIEDIYQHDMLFNYQHVSDRFGKFLCNWLSNRDWLEPIYDLFFGILYSSDSHPIQTFLSYIQAIETYHRRKNPDNFIDPPDVHKARKKEILKTAPPEYREWLKRNLAFSNAPTLAMRLQEIININPRPVVGFPGGPKSFIETVKETRNYYTHYDPHKKSIAASGGRLKGLSLILGQILEGILLLEMGFDIPEIQELQFKRRRLPEAWY